MAKITYASLKLKMNDEMVATKKFPEIMVKQYVSASDLIDLVDIVLERSFDGEIYNPVAIDAFLHLGIVYLYTNITFSEKQREDEFKLYDTLLSNGVISEVLNTMKEDEYERICDYLEIAKTDNFKYKRTILNIIKEISTLLPEMADSFIKSLSSIEGGEEYKKLLQSLEEIQKQGSIE